MSMHKIPLTADEREGLKSHGLDIGTPSQLSDVFRQGMAWANSKAAAECERLRLDNLSKNGSMKAFGEQIAALQRAVKNRDKLKARAETERDAALAELAALKGGQVAGKLQWPEIVGLVNEVLGCEAHKFPCDRGSIGHEMTGINFNSLARIIDLVRHSYPAPPAQASAWVPVSERLPNVENGRHQHVLVCVHRVRANRDYVFLLTFANGYQCLNGDDDPDADEYIEMHGWYDSNDDGDYCKWYPSDEGDRITHWQPLPAAPTPGASDGKGGEK